MSKKKIKQISMEELSKLKPNLIELKVDGIWTHYNEEVLYSSLGTDITHKFPHIIEALKELKLNNIEGEVAIQGGNVTGVSKKENWPRAKFYPFNQEEEIQTDLVQTPRRFSTVAEGLAFVNLTMSEGLVLDSKYKWKRLVEEKLKIISHEAGKLKGAFVLEREGITCKVSATSVAFVEEYKLLKEVGDVYAEVEYGFLTDKGRPFHPRLRRVFGGTNE